MSGPPPVTSNGAGGFNADAANPGRIFHARPQYIAHASTRPPGLGTAVAA